MKVSNKINIQQIYHEQVKKTQPGKGGDSFKKIMEGTKPKPEEAKKGFHPPSGLNIINPAFSGKPVPQAEPIDTMKFAAEVVANEPNIRQEKLEKIKKLIDKGQYNVSPEKVAEKLLKSGILTRSWEV